MKPFSKEFRGEVLAACDRGRSTREVATHFNVSESWVRRVKQERRELNKVAPDRELLSRVVFRGPGSGGVLQDSVGEHFSFENESDLVMPVESSPTSTG